MNAMKRSYNNKKLNETDERFAWEYAVRIGADSFIFHMRDRSDRSVACKLYLCHFTYLY